MITTEQFACFIKWDLERIEDKITRFRTSHYSVDAMEAAKALKETIKRSHYSDYIISIFRIFKGMDLEEPIEVSSATQDRSFITLYADDRRVSVYIDGVDYEIE